MTLPLNPLNAITSVASFNGTDGFSPVSNLIADSAGDLFGTTELGGANSSGTVFEIVKTATGYSSTPQVIASLGGDSGVYGSDAGLVFDSAGDLFGTAAGGVYSGNGAVFEITRSADGYSSSPKLIASFNPAVDGGEPQGGLIVDSAGDLLGTTLTGGAFDYGTVFEIVKTATGYSSTPQVIASFDGADGEGPYDQLIADSAGDLFGTTSGGSYTGSGFTYGTVFEIAKTAAGYSNTPTVIAFFDGTDGASPYAGLVADAAGNLYGTAFGGGAFNHGTVFEIAKTATGYSDTPQVLASFNPAEGGSGAFGGLIVDGAGNLFGTTTGSSVFDGNATAGTVFEVTKSDESYTYTPQVLAYFDGVDGSLPEASLFADSAGNLLGTTEDGGAYSQYGTVPGTYGTVFEVSNAGFSPACYCHGTVIRTDRGEVVVESLAIGDLVVTAGGDHRPIKWIGTRSYAGRFANANSGVLPICFKAGSLGENTPRRDLWVSPKHAMFIDGVLIPAEHLVNGISITQADLVERVDYFHIELDSHDVIVAEGALSETFVDDHSRAMFHNAPTFRALYPEAEQIDAIYCAPRVENGFALHAIRRRLAARAGLPVMAPVDLGMLHGGIDRIEGGVIEGWARNGLFPDARVFLDILVDGRVVMQVLADQFRSDLLRNGIGDGSHAFQARLPDVSVAGAVTMRRSVDRAPLRLSPDAAKKVVAPAGRLAA